MAGVFAQGRQLIARLPGIGMKDCAKGQKQTWPRVIQSFPQKVMSALPPTADRIKDSSENNGQFSRKPLRGKGFVSTVSLWA